METCSERSSFFLYVLFLFVSPFVRQFEHDAKVLALYMQSPVQALCPGKKPTEGATQPDQIHIQLSSTSR